MATKSSIHIKPCNIASSEAHNRRTAEYMRNIGKSKIYIVSELSSRQRTVDKSRLRHYRIADTLRQHQTDGQGKDRTCHAGERT